MKKTMLASFLLAASMPAAGALDMNDLVPCRPAAAKFCVRSGGLNWDNLLRCGATLAANSNRVGSECRAVLKRYGQL
jgi:hypothetical protein